MPGVTAKCPGAGSRVVDGSFSDTCRQLAVAIEDAEIASERDNTAFRDRGIGRGTPRRLPGVR